MILKFSILSTMWLTGYALSPPRHSLDFIRGFVTLCFSCYAPGTVPLFAPMNFTFVLEVYSSGTLASAMKRPEWANRGDLDGDLDGYHISPPQRTLEPSPQGKGFRMDRDPIPNSLGRYLCNPVYGTSFFFCDGPSDIQWSWQNAIERVKEFSKLFADLSMLWEDLAQNFFYNKRHPTHHRFNFPSPNTHR